MVFFLRNRCSRLPYTVRVYSPLKHRFISVLRFSRVYFPVRTLHRSKTAVSIFPRCGFFFLREELWNINDGYSHKVKEYDEGCFSPFQAGVGLKGRISRAKWVGWEWISPGKTPGSMSRETEPPAAASWGPTSLCSSALPASRGKAGWRRRQRIFFGCSFESKAFPWAADMFPMSEAVTFKHCWEMMTSVSTKKLTIRVFTALSKKRRLSRENYKEKD